MRQAFTTAPTATCRHCGFGIPTDAPLCPGCRRPAIDDWRTKVRSHKRAVRRSRRETAPPLREDGYRSLLTLATLARAALTAAAAVGVVTALAVAALTFRVDDPVVELGGTSIDLETVARSTTIALLGLLVVTGIAFVAWAVQAYRNLPALRIEERRYWTIWLVVGWVIPGANLLVPKLVVNDLWRASSPEVSVLGGDAWQRRPVHTIVNRWWCSFLVTPACLVLGLVTARGGIVEFEQQLWIGAASIVAAVSIAVAAVAARQLVAVVTVAQARRADVIVDLRESSRKAVANLAAMENGPR